MTGGFLEHLRTQLAELETAGLYKHERVIDSPQSAEIHVAGGGSVLNFCANNYLGLAHHPAIETAAHEGLQQHGYGMASVRFICGTQDVHRELEGRIAKFLGTDDAILYGSCFDANGGLFETLLGEEDAVISDALNHASIIDGVRLSKAKRYRYDNNDMASLEAQLEAARPKARATSSIATDGVFSMDGIIANLARDLRPRREARRDGDGGRLARRRLRGRARARNARALRRRWDGAHPHRHARQGARRALGRLHRRPREVVAWLRNRSRPYLFSNTLMPAIAHASLKVLDLSRRRRAAREARAQREHFRAR
jgi:glycine C-acetyltransferase